MKHVTKQLSTIAVIIAGIFLFTTCEEKKTTLALSPHHLVFNADDSSEKSITIETDATEWSYKVNSANWIDVYTKPRQFNKLFVKTQKNPDIEGSRIAVVTVTAGKSTTAEFSVEQLKKETNDLSVSQDVLEFATSETGGKSISITTDAPFWDAMSVASWVLLYKHDQTLTVSLQANPLGILRSAEIIITAGNALPVTVTVTQGVGINTLMVSPSYLTFAADATGVQVVTVTTNVPVWNATTDASWITLVMNGNLLSVSASPNITSSTRYATIRVTAAGAQQRTISVTQEAGTRSIITRTYYHATGIQLNNNQEYNASWAGEVIPNNALAIPNITITNWSGIWGPSIKCNFVNGKYRLDITSKIGDDTDGIHAGYMCMGTYNHTTKEIRLYPGVDYDVNFNAVTNVLDFSGTYNGLPTCIGMVAKNKNTGQWNTNRTYFNIYMNLKLAFTSTYSSSEAESNGQANTPFKGVELSKDGHVTIVVNK